MGASAPLIAILGDVQGGVEVAQSVLGYVVVACSLCTLDPQSTMGMWREQVSLPEIALGVLRSLPLPLSFFRLKTSHVRRLFFI